jgi:hypothetical protein
LNFSGSYHILQKYDFENGRETPGLCGFELGPVQVEVQVAVGKKKKKKKKGPRRARPLHG